MMRWTTEEDQILLEAVKECRTLKEATVLTSSKLPRTERGCYDRWQILKHLMKNEVTEVEVATQTEHLTDEQNHHVIKEMCKIINKSHKLKEENESLKSKNTKLDLENLDLLIENNQLRNEKEDIENKSNQIENEIKNIHMKNELMQADNEKLRIMYNEVTEELNKIKIENSNLKNEYEETKKDNNIFVAAFSKAREVIFGESDKPKFKMDRNGNLERVN